MLKEEITITTDADLVRNLLEESEELDSQVLPDFTVYTARHPVEGTLCIVLGALTDYTVITKVAE